MATPRKENPGKGGRPSTVTPQKVSLLIDAFSNGLNDQEACLYADIDENALYRYCAKFPEFREQKELLKRKPGIKAKLNVVKSIGGGDVQDSKWWLERRNRDEFLTKSEAVVANTHVLSEVDGQKLTDKERSDMLKAILTGNN